jgi:CRP/FNR family transcriptional regulator, putaive post-exponential-phase nitrogen-starvation regulator
LIEASRDKDEIAQYIEEFKMDLFLNKILLNNIRLFHFKAYETIIAEQTKTKFIYFLVDGQIKCAHYNSSGTLAVVAMMHPFSTLGDVEIVNNDLTVTSVISTCPSTVLGIPVSIVRKEGLMDPLFLKFINAELVKKLQSSTSLRLGHLVPVKSRLALYILSKADTREDTVIILPEKEALASMLGTTYRHLNRVLKDLIEERTLGPGYPGVRIKNIKNLQNLID